MYFFVFPYIYPEIHLGRKFLGQFPFDLIEMGDVSSVDDLGAAYDEIVFREKVLIDLRKRFLKIVGVHDQSSGHSICLLR